MRKRRVPTTEMKITENSELSSNARRPKICHTIY